ncbi:hypothetical protein [Arhodomonas sp. SL1]|uniref:hypothetical protein n=1 Tax=Arhodomonas sp. SL1 TaxID=3425691 RepID=UPI003F882838
MLKPQSFGVNKASTFTGFCTTHDDALFSPLEKDEFAATPQQCFLLLYRALARELYTKEASASLNDQRAEMDRGRDPLDQATIQTFMGDFSIGVNAGVRDNAIYKSTLDAMLVQDDYTDIRAYVIDSAAPPPVMCSGAFYPEQDFTGRELQDVADVSRTPDLLAVTSFYGGARGHVAFVWTESRSAACAAFIDSLDNLGDAEITSALVRLFFEHFENIHLQPDWWEQLSEDQRSSLIKRMTDSANPFAARPAAILADDGMRIPSWGLIGRRRLA